MNKTQEALNGLKHLEHVSAQLKTYSDQGQHKHIPSHLSAGHCYEIAKEMDSVIKACKEALAQPSHFGAEYMEGFNAGKMFAELEQPAQEPVACEKCNGKGCYQSGVGEIQCENCKGRGFDFSELHQTIFDNYVLTPNNPAPSWQGLSDDELQATMKFLWNNEPDFDEHDWYEFQEVARAIEQALKEKNANNT